jgi:hypothetical protein
VCECGAMEEEERSPKKNKMEERDKRKSYMRSN